MARQIQLAALILLTGCLPSLVQATTLGVAFTYTRAYCTNPYERGQPSDPTQWRDEQSGPESSTCSTALGDGYGEAEGDPSAGPGAVPVLRLLTEAIATGEAGTVSGIRLLQNRANTGVEAEVTLIDELRFEKEGDGPDAAFLSMFLTISGATLAGAPTDVIACPGGIVPSRCYDKPLAAGSLTAQITAEQGGLKTTVSNVSVARAGTDPGIDIELESLDGTNLHLDAYAIDPSGIVSVTLKARAVSVAQSDHPNQTAKANVISDESVYFGGVTLYDASMNPIAPGIWSVSGAGGIDWTQDNFAEAVPVPATLPLLISGLTLCIVGAWRREPRLHL